MLAMIGLTFVVTEMGGDKKDPNPETNENDKNHERREKAKQRQLKKQMESAGFTLVEIPDADKLEEG